MDATRIMTSVLATIIAVAISGITFAQTTPPGPGTPEQSTSSPGTPEQSNRGGALRGLDRADEVAGEHGKQGRDRARAAQERANRPERSERPDRPQRPERPERPGNPNR
jgi:hypothetical protein